CKWRSITPMSARATGPAMACPSGAAGADRVALVALVAAAASAAAMVLLANGSRASSMSSD
ncbi:MAG: hypothetical protein P8P57_02585, partial [Burkholderiaceae bacterium]|nr:hypothetical protein [Burkholderiaceae bacterium]